MTGDNPLDTHDPTGERSASLANAILQLTKQEDHLIALRALTHALAAEIQALTGEDRDAVLRGCLKSIPILVDRA